MRDPDGWWGTRPPDSGHTFIQGAHRPWLDADAPMAPYQGPEPQAGIDRCLTCPFPAGICTGRGRCDGIEHRGRRPVKAKHA